ncbi:hypothetical protein IEQ34_016301 [Dendrobium chrysotoxum]|uniref:Uncharacterized protein n=1 Tax=Dendrobium chrysotoxum TaxID=161865 RepID=A0AAV7GDX7_DENCH|nr:hypothetical protein IEQ34_016301 [Dendrobium chrysotoxum]
MVGSRQLLANASAVEYANPGSRLILARSPSGLIASLAKSLGLACLKVGQHLDSIGTDDHEKILSFEWRSLKILDDMDMCLLQLPWLSIWWFRQLLSEVTVIHAVQLQLANTKTTMGRSEETLLNLKRCLEFKESIF